MNPDLIDSQHPQQVPALAALTRPLGSTLQEEFKSYICTVPNASTHRADGKKLPFVYGFMRTNIKQDIAHMEHEIDELNPYFRHATAQEIEAYDMRTDPRGTLTRNITAELTPQLRAEIELSVRAELEEKIRKEMAESAAADRELKTTDTTAANHDANKISGTDAVARAKEISDRIKASQESKAPGVTVVHQNKPLITPVSSADLAAGSAAQSGK